MGMFSKPKAQGPDPETVRLQREQSERIAEREAKLAKQEEDLALEKEKRKKRQEESRLAGKRGLGGLLSGGFSGFQLGESSKLS